MGSDHFDDFCRVWEFSYHFKILYFCHSAFHKQVLTKATVFQISFSYFDVFCSKAVT